LKRCLVNEVYPQAEVKALALHAWARAERLVAFADAGLKAVQ